MLFSAAFILNAFVFLSKSFYTLTELYSYTEEPELQQNQKYFEEGFSDRGKQFFDVLFHEKVVFGDATVNLYSFSYIYKHSGNWCIYCAVHCPRSVGGCLWACEKEACGWLTKRAGGCWQGEANCSCPIYTLLVSRYVVIEVNLINKQREVFGFQSFLSQFIIMMWEGKKDVTVKIDT